MSYKCSPRMLSNAVATSSIGWGIMLLSLLLLVLLTVFRSEAIISIPDDYIWGLICAIVFGGVLAICGSSASKSCIAGNLASMYSDEERKLFDED